MSNKEMTTVRMTDSEYFAHQLNLISWTAATDAGAAEEMLHELMADREADRNDKEAPY